MQTNADKTRLIAQAQQPPAFRQLENAEWVADALKISESTLAKWRCAGIGPQFYKMSGRVVYDRADIERYLDGCRVATTSQSGQAA